MLNEKNTIVWPENMFYLIKTIKISSWQEVHTSSIRTEFVIESEFVIEFKVHIWKINLNEKPIFLFWQFVKTFENSCKMAWY